VGLDLGTRWALRIALNNDEGGSNARTVQYNMYLYGKPVQYQAQFYRELYHGGDKLLRNIDHVLRRNVATVDCLLPKSAATRESSKSHSGS
jgi:hypothetical protein